uniref:glucuronosyltransferase n=1 Tax=Parastrongyloides trichosuri TaxID=131310 RepID=A0A0N4ZIS6_PARTI
MFPFLIFLSIVINTLSYKILIFNPMFATSHIKYMNNLGDLLQEGGHNVTILRAPMAKYLEHIKAKKAKEIGLKYRSEIIDKKAEVMKVVTKDSWTQRNTENPFSIVSELYGASIWFAETCEFVIQDQELMEVLTNEKFDLGIVEAFIPCGYGVLNYLNITKHVSVMSGAPFDSFYSRFGLSIFNTLIPSITSPFTPDMTYFQRVYNFFAHISMEIVHYNHNRFGNQVFRKYEKTKDIDLDEEFKKTAFFVSNDDPIVSYSVPQCPKILRLGGLLTGEPKPLDEMFNTLLSKRDKNVVISFGSIAQSYLMTDEMKMGLVKVFKAFPNVTFIWKYEKERPNILNGIDNVETFKWIPQVDLLNDTRVSLLVTHGGMNTLNEVAKFGVPVLSMPLFGDQPRNSKMYEFAKIGKMFDKKYLGKDNDYVVLLFKELLENKMYTENAKKISILIKNRPYDLKETFLKHIDYAAKFGNIEQLSVYSKDLTWWKFAMLDIFAGIIFVIFLIIYTALRIYKNIKLMVSYVKSHEKED